jgi:precorrin-2 dehydrogenase/sirohydrochlorin ferrochelatase
MTVPLALDLALLPTALVGAGPALAKRLAVLDGESVPGLTIYAPDADPALRAAAGGRLAERLPTEAEIASFRVLFIAGLPETESARLVGLARDHRVLVNAEDVMPLCDFHMPSILRRGDLSIAISTGGKSPTLARRLRAYLERMLPAEWSERLGRIAEQRDTMRRSGATPGEVMAATDALIDREGWLK